MAVYVDDSMIPFGRMKMCHMMTDGDIQELHDFAKRIGMKREWFQDHPRHPHYDVSISMRNKALKMGAISVGRIEIVYLCSKRGTNNEASAKHD